MTVLKPLEDVCEVCGRRVYKRGVVLMVEAAIDPKGESQIVAQLELLRTSRRDQDRRRFEDLIERFKQLAVYGELEVPDQMREIHGDLWEIKTSIDRVPFYRRSAANHRLTARLAFLFEKSRGKTAQGKIPRALIDKGNWIMNGDKAHD